MTQPQSNQGDGEQIRKLLFDFAKYVRLASMQANEKISAMYQLDDKANVDVTALLNDTAAYILRLGEQERHRYELLARLDELESYKKQWPLMVFDYIDDRVSDIQSQLTKLDEESDRSE